MKRPSYLMIENVSDETSAEMEVQIFKDMSGAAMAWSQGSGDVRPNGIVAPNGTTTATIDLNYNAGIMYLCLFDQWARFWRYAMTQEKPAGSLKLMDMKFLIRNRQEIDAKVKVS
jgi:hypothetical protein